jgi:hypothetical protein
MSNYPHKLYLDSETVGLHSMPVLFQFAYGDGPVQMYDIWKKPISGAAAVIRLGRPDTGIVITFRRITVLHVSRFEGQHYARWRTQ